MALPRGREMDTQHQQIDRARSDPADRPVASTRWMSALLPGAVGVTVLGPGAGTPAGAVLRWATPADPLATGALWLAVALLCLAVPVGISHLVAIQAAGRRVRGKGRWRGLAGFPGRPPGRPAERTPAKTRPASGCPVPHGQAPESGPNDARQPGSPAVG